MEKITFTMSVIAFYIKGEISREQNFVKFRIPNKLGIIPLGSNDENIPITQISLVRMRYKIKPFWFVVGFILAFVDFLVCTEMPSLRCILLMLLGILMMVCSVRKCLDVDLTSGRVIRVPFVIYEWNKAGYAAAMINGIISDRLDDTNVRIHTDRSIDDNREQTDRIIDAINGKRNRF